MRRVLLAGLCLSFALSNTHARDGGLYVVRESASPCLKFRPNPSSESAPEDCLAPATRVTVLESVPYWRKVRLDDGRTGWVAKMYLELVSATEDTGGGPDSNAWLEVHFVDVGQGDGIWIHTHDDGIDGNDKYEGRSIAIDGGPKPSVGEKEFWEYIEEKGHHNGVIDALFLSHPHDDHYPGADGIRRHFRIGKFYDPGFPKTGVAYPNFLGAMRQDQA
ncbi:MAG TPA: SH3 domain-containing protein, partial [Candidatus Polarisedimenticolia bacterium]|nr:SH3 domain-containing protein [Candidatus Polarisedimenticolia bacterium]